MISNSNDFRPLFMLVLLFLVVCVFIVYVYRVKYVLMLRFFLFIGSFGFPFRFYSLRYVKYIIKVFLNLIISALKARFNNLSVHTDFNWRNVLNVRSENVYLDGRDFEGDERERKSRESFTVCL